MPLPNYIKIRLADLELEHVDRQNNMAYMHSFHVHGVKIILSQFMWL
jgi:hypothetical protein